MFGSNIFQIKTNFEYFCFKQENLVAFNDEHVYFESTLFLMPEQTEDMFVFN